MEVIKRKEIGCGEKRKVLQSESCTFTVLRMRAIKEDFCLNRHFRKGKIAVIIAALYTETSGIISVIAVLS